MLRAIAKDHHCRRFLIINTLSRRFCFLSTNSARQTSQQPVHKELARKDLEQQQRPVIITGGTYGIGKGIVRLFASRGDAVVIAGRNADLLSKPKSPI